MPESSPRGWLTHSRAVLCLYGLWALLVPRQAACWSRSTHRVARPYPSLSKRPCRSRVPYARSRVNEALGQARFLTVDCRVWRCSCALTRADRDDDVGIAPAGVWAMAIRVAIPNPNAI